MTEDFQFSPGADVLCIKKKKRRAWVYKKPPENIRNTVLTRTNAITPKTHVGWKKEDKILNECRPYNKSDTYEKKVNIIKPNCLPNAVSSPNDDNARF